MATVSDLTSTPLSGQTYIDALLGTGPDWNYLTTSTSTISYTFSVAAGNESSETGQAAFSASQQQWARYAINYLSNLTGIQFVETTDGTAAQIHFASVDLAGSNTTGLTSWTANYGTSGGQLVSYDVDAYVYLDNDRNWAAQNADLTPGGDGYETLLHELGHALGLKHPFDTTTDNTTVLSSGQDNTANTLMSYTHAGGPYSTYQQDDVAALMWLYGGDGLRGALGINSTNEARYLVGTSGVDTLTGTGADDKFQGNGGNDMINGGAGTDTAVFREDRNNYTFTQLANGDLQVASKDGSDGTDTLHSIELLQFGSASAIQAAAVLADTTPPVAPTLTVAVNSNDYVAGGDLPSVTGGAEANAVINVLDNHNKVVATTTADATGLWSVELSGYADGVGYQIHATATDAAGNTSAASATVTFNVDSKAPEVPAFAVNATQGSNLATFSGTGEAGTLIELVRSGDYIDIATTTVDANGHWSVTTSPLPNGSYEVQAVSSDKADNATVSASPLTFTVNSSANLAGTAANDTLVATAGGNAIDGQDGLDTVVYSGNYTNYTVAKETWGYGVTDNKGTGGHDAVINVERLQFADTAVALDIDGTGGEVYRLYQAVLGRSPDAPGLGFWIYQMDHGATLNQIASAFMTDQPEFTQLYGSNPSDADFITALYTNVLHRAPEGAGYDYWMNALTTLHTPREQVLTFFSESLENQAQVIGSIQNGFAYTPWTVPAAA